MIVWNRFLASHQNISLTFLSIFRLDVFLNKAVVYIIGLMLDCLFFNTTFNQILRSRYIQNHLKLCFSRGNMPQITSRTGIIKSILIEIE